MNWFVVWAVILCAYMSICLCASLAKCWKYGWSAISRTKSRLSLGHFHICHLSLLVLGNAWSICRVSVHKVGRFVGFFFPVCVCVSVCYRHVSIVRGRGKMIRVIHLVPVLYRWWPWGRMLIQYSLLPDWLMPVSVEDSYVGMLLMWYNSVRSLLFNQNHHSQLCWRHVHYMQLCGQLSICSIYTY